jgi:hypothetical protein
MNKPTLNRTEPSDICPWCKESAQCSDFSAEDIRQKNKEKGHNCCYDVPFRSEQQLENLLNEFVGVFIVEKADTNENIIIVRDRSIYMV